MALLAVNAQEKRTYIMVTGSAMDVMELENKQQHWKIGQVLQTFTCQNRKAKVVEVDVGDQCFLLVLQHWWEVRRRQKLCQRKVKWKTSTQRDRIWGFYLHTCYQMSTLDL